MNKLSQLKGHRILFIGIGFYDYDQSIIAELKKLNKEVSYFSTHTNIWNLLIFKRLHLNKISEKNIYVDKIFLLFLISSSL